MAHGDRRGEAHEKAHEKAHGARERRMRSAWRRGKRTATEEAHEKRTAIGEAHEKRIAMEEAYSNRNHRLDGFSSVYQLDIFASATLTTIGNYSPEVGHLNSLRGRRNSRRIRGIQHPNSLTLLEWCKQAANNLIVAVGNPDSVVPSAIVLNPAGVISARLDSQIKRLHQLRLTPLVLLLRHTLSDCNVMNQLLNRRLPTISDASQSAKLALTMFTYPLRLPGSFEAGMCGRASSSILMGVSTVSPGAAFKRCSFLILIANAGSAISIGLWNDPSPFWRSLRFTFVSSRFCLALLALMCSLIRWLILTLSVSSGHAAFAFLPACINQLS
ncbi:hypothetical protein J1614_004258 [Plenodomus biglobosus]|nr:hypothetical protein J1614_004258 [Plenodomus biglobosus]